MSSHEHVTGAGFDFGVFCGLIISTHCCNGFGLQE